MIKITSRGLEIDNPSMEELKQLDKIMESIRAEERDQIIARIEEKSECVCGC